MVKLLPLLILFTYVSCKNQSSTTEKDNVIQSQEQKIKELEERLNKVEQPNGAGTRDSVDYSQIYIAPKENRKEYYSIGATESEVLDIQGEPSSINDFGSGKMFMYGASIVTFRNDKVVSYSNLDNNLKIRVSSKTLSTSNSSPQTVTPKGKTKYVYYTCYLKEFGEMTKYISKIYTIENYSDEKMWKIRDCLTEQVRFFKQIRDNITILPEWFDTYSDASTDRSSLSGGQMPGQDLCN